MKISVHGLGRLGLPLALVLADAGHDVIGVEKSVDQLVRISENDLWHEDGLEELNRRHKISLTSDGADAALEADVSMIIVPTPSGKDDMFANDFVVTVATEIGRGLIQKDTEHLVVLVSTVMPGASDEVVIPAIEKASGKKLNDGFYFCYSPEFIALGTVIRDMCNPSLVLIGESCEEAGVWFGELSRSYAHMPVLNEYYCGMSILDAEIAKIALNTYVTMKISFANQLDEFCERVGADSTVITDAIAHDPRIGAKCLSPGTPFGGPCFPRDARAFLSAATRVGVSAELAEATTSVNDRQVRRMLAKVHALGGKRIAVLGLTYKTQTTITEQAFGTRLVKALLALNYEVIAYDPLVQPETFDQLVDADLFILTLPYDIFRTVDYSDKKVIDCWNML